MNAIQHRWWQLTATVNIIKSWLIRLATKIRPRQVMCMSYGGKSYSCNPRYITEYLLAHKKGEYRIIWALDEGVDPSVLPTGVEHVRKGSLKYLYRLNTSEFVIANSRTRLPADFWIKRKGQRYIMTWHSSMGLKRIEADAHDLSEKYMKYAMRDSRMCDLIISGSQFRTGVINRAFGYDGEVLMAGTPRNDALFADHSQEKAGLLRDCNLPADIKLILYAPTFRVPFNLDDYLIEYESILKAFEEKLGGRCALLVRLHPNVSKHSTELQQHYCSPFTVNVTKYPDMQLLLAFADVLITDYSSSMFDIALLEKPCFLFAPDINTYSRGTYFQINELPFPNATDTAGLLSVIRGFDKTKYVEALHRFDRDVIGSYEQGKASYAVAQWMDSKVRKIGQ